MKNKHHGAIAELIACQWLLEQGYDVFRNVSAHGKYDVIAMDPETLNTIVIDVTGGSLIKVANKILIRCDTRKFKKKGKILIVYNGECMWQDDPRVYHPKSHD